MVAVEFSRGKYVTKLDAKHRASSLAALASWRKKFQIGEKVKIYYDTDLTVGAFFFDNLIFYLGFIKTGLRLPLNPLVVSIMNYF